MKHDEHAPFLTNGELFQRIFGISVADIRSLPEEEFTDWLNAVAENASDLIYRTDALRALDEHRYSSEFCVNHYIDWSINLGMAHIVLNDLKSVNEKT